MANVVPHTAERDPAARITQVRHQTINDILQPRDWRAQPLDGFDDVYSDIVHYVAYCTHRIWAEKSIGLIYTHYDPAVVVITPAGTTNSVEHVMASTLSTMQAFPDRESRLVNVAWAGNAREGFYTSHLGMSQMTNLGPTPYGAATGKRVKIRHCADCRIKDNRIFYEWLVRDNGALVRQLGFNPHDIARRAAASIGSVGQGPAIAGIPERTQGQRLPEPLDWPRVSTEDKLRHLFHDVWNQRLLDRLATGYTPDCVVHTAPGRELEGINGLTWWVIRMLAAFPDAVMTVEHYCDVEESDGLIAAVRWTLNGTHRGDGLFGPPTGKPAVIMGISHFRFDGDRIAEEWTVFDEIAVLAQLYAETNMLAV